MSSFGSRAVSVIDTIRSSGMSAYARAWITGADVTTTYGTDRVYQPYAQHPTVYRAIKIKADSIGQLDVEVWPRSANRSRDKPVENHWLPALLSSPSNELRGEQLIQAVVTYLDTEGEAFLWHLDIGRDGAGKPKHPRAIALLSPRTMWPKYPLGPLGEVTGWTWHSPRGPISIPLEELTFIKYFNPYQPERGLAPIKAAMIEYTGDYRAAVWNRSLIENNAMPPIFFSSELAWAEEDRREFIDDFQERFGGATKTGRAAALPQGVKAEAFKVSHLEMEWLGGRRFSREQIFSVLGVPPGIGGIFDGGNYANRREQMKFLWQVTLMPIVRLLEATLTDLLRRYETDQVVFFKVEPVLADVNAEDYAKKVETASRLMSWGWPPSAVNNALALGLPTAGMPWLDEGYLPYSLVVARDVVEGTTLATPDPTDGTDGGGTDADESDETTVDEKNDEKGPGKAVARLLATLEGRASGDDREQVWTGIASKYGDIGRAYNRRLRSWLWGMRSETLENIRTEKAALARLSDLVDQGQLQGRETIEETAAREAKARAAGDDLLWKQGPAQVKLKAISKVDWLQAIDRGVKVLEGETGIEIDFDVHDPAVTSYLGVKEMKIVNIEERIREDVRATLIEGLALNETEAELAARVRERFDVERHRSVAIARTETGQAFSTGRYEGMKDAGITKHEWITAHDGDVRESHRAQDGDVVLIGEPFKNGCRLPGDLQAPAEETINCRCATKAIVEA